MLKPDGLTDFDSVGGIIAIDTSVPLNRPLSRPANSRTVSLFLDCPLVFRTHLILFWFRFTPFQIV